MRNKESKCLGTKIRVGGVGTKMHNKQTNKCYETATKNALMLSA